MGMMGGDYNPHVGPFWGRQGTLLGFLSRSTANHKVPLCKLEKDVPSRAEWETWGVKTRFQISLALPSAHPFLSYPYRQTDTHARAHARARYSYALNTTHLCMAAPLSPTSLQVLSC